MPKQTPITASKVLPLFGSGVPLCWCGASAEPSAIIGPGQPLRATLCRAHWLSEKQLLAQAIARLDAVLALHPPKADNQQGKEQR